MSIINQVREIIDNLDEQQFTIHDFAAIWEVKGGDPKRLYNSVSTCLSKLKTYYGEIEPAGKGDGVTHSLRVVLYKACDIDNPKIKKSTFENRIGGKWFNPKLNDIFVSCQN